MELGSNHPSLHVLGTNYAYLQLRAELRRTQLNLIESKAH
jgi:hypothetical protein